MRFSNLALALLLLALMGGAEELAAEELLGIGVRM